MESPTTQVFQAEYCAADPLRSYSVVEYQEQYPRYPLDSAVAAYDTQYTRVERRQDLRQCELDC